MDAAPFSKSNHPAWHYEPMLADGLRMRRYRQAIEAMVRPGDVVADLGTGIGVLAVMAARAGAKRVHAVERRPGPLAIADKIVRDNGVVDRVRLVEGDCRNVELDEPVDLIVSELLGDFGTDEDVFDCVAAFARRNLRPGGRILPRRLRTYLAPVEFGPEFHGVWRSDWHGLDLRAGNAEPVAPEATLYALRQRARELAAPAVLEDVRFGRAMGERASRLEARFDLTRAGSLEGFVGWFAAELCEGVGIESYPCYPGCHWRNWTWPVAPPRQVAPGQRISARLDTQGDLVAGGWKLDWALV